jgi:hypothetical protein
MRASFSTVVYEKIDENVPCEVREGSGRLGLG